MSQKYYNCESEVKKKGSRNRGKKTKKETYLFFRKD